MSPEMTALLAKIDAGWEPPPIPKAEYLARLRLIIEGLLEKTMQLGDAAYPGLLETLNKMVEQEAQLAKEVAGASERGGLS